MKVLPATVLPDMRERIERDELMEDPEADEAVLLRTVDQFRITNAVLSRMRGLLDRFVVSDIIDAERASRPAVSPRARGGAEPSRVSRSPVRVLDVGAGGGDIARWLAERCRKRGLDVRITCIDIDPRIVDHARRTTASFPEIEVKRMSAFEIDRLPPFEYAYANHVFHHFPDRRLPELFELLRGRTRRAFIVNDLVRSRLSYLGFSLFASLFLRNSFAKTDGLVSIRKGFRTGELRELATDGLSATNGTGETIEVFTRFPGRVVVFDRKGGRGR